MNKKIGRNDSCPCGSGKKNKKCHNIDRWPTTTVSKKENISSTKEYIQTHESKHLLNEIISLQLLPENHGKNIRIEELATLVVKNLNNGKIKDLNKLYDSVKKEYAYNYNEDPVESIYTENVIFYGGNFTVFPGIALEPVEIFKNLTHIIFNTDIKLPDAFRAQVYKGITLLLHIGQEFANKAKITGNTYTESESQELVHFDKEVDFSISKTELIKICSFLQIDPNIINDFIIDPEDVRFQNNDPQFNPLLFYPIVEFNNEYFFILISNQVNALNEYILRLAKKYNCEKKLLLAYQEEIWTEVMIACQQMGWAETDIKLPEDENDIDIKEAILHFDNNRLAYVSLQIPLGLSDLFSNQFANTRQRSQERLTKVITELKKRPELLESKFLTVSLYDSIGRFFMGMMQTPQERELKLSFSAYNFITLSKGEDWERLSLWKFAKASDIFLRKAHSMSSMIDIYNVYKSKGQGFYFSDDTRPDYVMVAPGDGSKLIRETKLKANYHATPIKIEGNVVFMPVTRIADFAPIYKPTKHLGYFLQALETFSIPLWITNTQIRKNSMVPAVRLYADAISFWLHKFQTSLMDYINQAGTDPLEIEIKFDPAIFEEMTSLEMKEQSDGQYLASYIDGKIIFNIPSSSLTEFMGSKNEGERIMMKEVLNALNLIDGISINDDEIDNIIEHHMPLNQAKMILISDSQQDLLIERRWLVEEFLLTDAEVEMLLDELPGMIETKMSIPEKIINPDDKKTLFNTATTVLIEKLKNEIGVFNHKELLIALLKLHEALVQKREYNKTIIPAQLLCFGGIEDKVNEILENEKNLVRTSVALRALIEYLSAQPISGSLSPSLDDIDRLLALMHEVVNFGFLSDAVHFKMDDPEVGKLPSGRIGISRDFFEEKLKPYTESNTKAEIDDYISNFEDRFETYNPDEENDVDSETLKSVEELDEAFVKDWGITFSNLYTLFYHSAMMCMQAEESVITISEVELIERLVTDLKLPREQAIAGIDRLVLSPRDSYLTAPESYNNSEVFPWKYNREFSLTRRFFVRHVGSDKKNLLSWGFRTAIATQKQLQYLLHSGKLNNGGTEIKKLMGAFRVNNGNVYRNIVKDWLSLQSDFVVIDYEVKIAPRAPLHAEKQYGDVDVLALHKPTGTVFSIECKNTTKAKNIHEMKTEMDSYLGREGGKGMITKHVDRHNWLIDNRDQLQKLFKIDTPITVKSLMLSSEVIPTPYIKSEALPLPIIAFHDLKREGTKLLFE
ncbi:hypothetical protein J2X31_002208 [Flavobacterium arsenatis]|uniref:SEC-C domain-containing protein n=1 Tax=Flavobacterium arsenatis TaxID=1484332 RepID=A0ABU1TQN4_9FLAO|nr:SEC-C metal-binding domain-containing protein [Flavobacterium arsenatis]MDR6968193.1 hypothetical protein [Flavobacterium arsenatis]